MSERRFLRQTEILSISSIERIFSLLYLLENISALYINERRFCGRCTLKTESQYRRLYRLLRTVCGDRSIPAG